MHTREDVTVPETILVENGVANPASFVDYKKVESFFDNARQYVMWVLKNVEGQVETASRHGECPQLNDEEVQRLAISLCRSIFKADSPKRLSEENKKRLAVRLKRDYYPSNGQLARSVNLSPDVINSLFPLSAPNK